MVSVHSSITMFRNKILVRTICPCFYIIIVNTPNFENVIVLTCCPTYIIIIVSISSR